MDLSPSLLSLVFEVALHKVLLRCLRDALRSWFLGGWVGCDVAMDSRYTIHCGKVRGEIKVFR